MTGQEKEFFIIGRSIDGWLEMRTPDDKEGECLSVPLKDEFVDGLISYLEEVGCPEWIIKEMREAEEWRKEVIVEEEKEDAEED